MPLTLNARPATAQGRADITLALINNMPDRALEATERQFCELLHAASGALRVRLIFSYLPEVPRGPAASTRLAAHYTPLAQLDDAAPDGLIVTGMEPGTGSLDQTPLWPPLAALVDWARTRTLSCIWSCLAAHAAVLRLDGIERQRLGAKRFGVFAHEVLRGHPLMSGVQAPLLTPHSRWNELPVPALRAAGYTLLSGSADTGADTFAKQAGSLFVFFQGHPEYEADTLLKEYRRDVGRFARGEQPHHPQLPQGYFPAATAQLLTQFRERLTADPSPDTCAQFPAESAAAGLTSPWRLNAVRIYSNWLSLIIAVRQQLPGASSHASAR